MDSLKILIVSTPKTGNTWLRNLLASIYKLPQGPPLRLDPESFRWPSERWITFQHNWPTPDALELLKERKVVTITTIRHPADVLISLYHHIHQFKKTYVDHEILRRMLTQDFQRTDVNPEYWGGPFSQELALSIEWMQTGAAHTMRYEDLRSDTRRVLLDLTNNICEVGGEHVDAAIQACDLHLMRKLARKFGGFFREGRIGGWRDILPPDVIEIFGNEPYASQMAALGYTMETESAVCHQPTPKHPFTAISHFESGASIAPILVKCFFLADIGLQREWEKQPSSISSGSFYDWLNGAADINGAGIYEDLPISNLAAFIYSDGPDLRAAFPNLASRSRIDFIQWFLRYGNSVYDLDAVFINPVRRRFVQWATGEVQPPGNTHRPVMRFVLHLYAGRPDLQAAFPDLWNGDADSATRWVIDNGEALALEPELIEALAQRANHAFARTGRPLAASS